MRERAVSEPKSGLKTALPAATAHLCIDMQRMFTDEGPWPTPWMERVLPTVVKLATARAGQTIFTRFIPPQRPEDMSGRWVDFYRHWRKVTREHLDPQLIELVPALAGLVPPATVLDKPYYSPFFRSGLADLLAQRRVEALVVSGAETDVCVLAAVMHAVDLGLRVVIARDALCSGNDETHDALMKLYEQRFSQQVELADSAEILDAW